MGEVSHTPGKLSQDDGLIRKVSGEILGVCALKPDAQRIVACVNACDGIADPSVVPELVAALELAVAYLSEVPPEPAMRIAMAVAKLRGEAS